MFQFHTVQLKGNLISEQPGYKSVSIPYGSIKGMIKNDFIRVRGVSIPYGSIKGQVLTSSAVTDPPFQFHTVQLKVVDFTAKKAK